MPKITTRGKSPGVTLIQGEVTRWRANIEDIKAIRRNETNAADIRDLDDAGNLLDKLLTRYGPKDKDGPSTETKSPSLKTA